MWKDFEYKHLLEIPPKKLPCFLAGTPVLTEQGLQPIELIKSGDKIYTHNFKTGKQELKPVLETYTNHAEKYVSIEINNTEIIQATGGHRFWVEAQKRWIRARNLKVGMKLYTKALHQGVITRITIKEKIVPTYNLSVADNPNYFVGQHQILTHNTNKISAFSSLFTKDVEFYTLSGRNGNLIKDYYVGQTIQGFDKRFSQHLTAHRKNRLLRPWMEEVDGSLQIRINGKLGPFKMTPFEAAVVEMHELYKRGGKRVGGRGLYNKVNPVSKLKFNIYKKVSHFNPCEFYV